jgi:hypothetical protein
MRETLTTSHDNDRTPTKAPIVLVEWPLPSGRAERTAAMQKNRQWLVMAYSVEKVGPTKYCQIAGVLLPFRDWRSSILRRSERSIFHQPKSAAEKPTFSTQ